MKVLRFLVGRAPVVVLVSVAVVTAQLWMGTSAASAATAPPAGSTVIGPGCPGWNRTHADWDTHAVWSTAGGDYTGSPIVGGSGSNCNGTSQYVMDGTANTATFRWHLEVDTTTAASCHIWAYIPTQKAGDRHAWYDFWADDGLSGLRWLGWPGHTVDQENTSGWTDLGGVNVPASTYLLTVTLNNQDTKSPGWPAGAGDMAFNCTPTPVMSSDSARNDLLQRLQGQPALLLRGLHDNMGNTMDTAKVIQVGASSYLAVYTTNFTVKLATSGDLANWSWKADLDMNGSQPYLAEAPSGAFVLGVEQQDSPGSSTSHLFFLHYPGLSALESASSDKTWHIPTRSQRFFSGFAGVTCNEGTPDIHGTNYDGTSISFGFHWLANCFTGLDREAFGSLTNFSSATATQDTVRDDAVTSIAYPGKHGGRDDIMWRGYRFSLQEAQNSDANLGDYTTWRFVLYDYSNRHAYPAPITSYISSSCHGNPKITLLTDQNGHLVILVTGYIFAECAAPGESGELLYTVPAQ